MALITRSGKGSPLTIEEMDGNFTYLESISGSGGATPSLQDVTDIGSVTTNTITIGNTSSIYSLIEDKSLFINYYDAITQSNTNRGYFSVFNEWDGLNWFEVYYETYNGASFSYYDIYAQDGQINLYTKSETDVVRGFKIEDNGFTFQGSSNNVILNIDDVASSYTLKLPNKSVGTYTLATTNEVLSISDINTYYSTNSFSAFSQITIKGSSISTDIKLRNEDNFFRINAFGNTNNSAFVLGDFGIFGFVSGDNLKYASFDYSGNTDTLNTNYTLINKSGKLPIFNTTAVASSSATGVAGEIRVNSGFIYVCTATNTWLRASIASW